MEENFLQSLLRTSQDAGIEIIAWKTCEAVEIVEAYDNAKVDIDYILLTGICKDLIISKPVEKLLSNCSGIFSKLHHVDAYRKDKRRKLFKICDIKPLSIALDIFQQIDEIEEEFNQFSPVYEHGLESSAYEDINEELAKLTKMGSVPFRTVQENLLSLVPNLRIAVYQYGQKQPLDSFLSLIEKPSNDIEVEIALGIELEMKDFVLLASKEGTIIGKEFFPLFLSQQAGSIQQKEDSIKDVNGSGCYRLSVYNTTHHSRKNFVNKIRLSELKESSENLLWRFSTMATTFLLKYSKELLPHWQRNKLRLEGYFPVGNNNGNDSITSRS